MIEGGESHLELRGRLEEINHAFIRHELFDWPVNASAARLPRGAFVHSAVVKQSHVRDPSSVHSRNLVALLILYFYIAGTSYLQYVKLIRILFGRPKNLVSPGKVANFLFAVALALSPAD
jgi:hypothetical protein